MKTSYASLRPESQATPALGKKEHAEKEISLVATSDKGSAPLTAPPFEKGGRKLSHAVALNSSTNQNLKIKKGNYYEYSISIFRNLRGRLFTSLENGLCRLL